MPEDMATPPSTTEPAQEHSLEIHKPKPVHNWRDFLKELGTIVLGIVIAIALEHLVQEWSWDRQVKVARQALFEEITANNLNLHSYRVAVAPCINRQLEQVEAVLAALEAGTKPQKITWRPAIGAGMRSDEWQSERASQVLTHFPPAELAMFSRFYGQLDHLQAQVDKEGDAWDQLDVLQNSPAGLTASDLTRLRTNFAIAKRMAYLVALNSQRQLRLSKQIGVPDQKADPERVKNYCTLSMDEFRRYRSTQDLR